LVWERIVARDDDGFSDFVASRAPALLRTAWMLTGDAQLAEDLLQSALARAWPHWPRIGGDRPEAYVRKVMVRLHGTWWRRRWNGELPTADMPETIVGDAYAAADERAVLRSALLQLPKRQRLAVVLRYYDDLPEQEVAALMGCTVGTVKSQAAKGLARLRTALEPNHTVEGLR
jgi:RNA polymerase sigma-70 factor (sigma-E family)